MSLGFPVRVNGQWRLPNAVLLLDQLNFGGVSASYPALIRNSNQLRVRLADNSNFANLEAGNVIANSANYFNWSGRASVYSSGDGAVNLTNNAANGFTRLILGQQSSGYPVLEPKMCDLTTAAGGTTSAIGTSNSNGLLFVANSSGASAIYAIKGAMSTTAEVFDSGTLFSAVGGTTNMINVYWDSTAASYSFENQTGSTVSVTALFVGRRLS